MRYASIKSGKSEMRGSLWDINEAIHGRAPLQMVQLLEKGEHNPSQISRDHHVTRSLLYVWWQLYRERGEAAFVPTQAFQSPPEVEATVWTTGPRTRSTAIGG